MPDTAFHSLKGGSRHPIAHILHQLGICLFIPVKFLQGITGLGIQIIRHTVLHRHQCIRYFVQPQIPLIDLIDLRRHAVDSQKQYHRHCKYYQIRQYKNAAHLRLKRQLSKFFPHAYLTLSLPALVNIHPRYSDQ